MNTLLGQISCMGVIVLLVFQVCESKPPFSKKPTLSSDDDAPSSNIIATKLTIMNSKEAKLSYGVRTDPNSPIKMHKVLIPLSQAITSSSSSSSSSESGSGSISASSSESGSFETIPKTADKAVPKKQMKIAAAVRKFAAGIKQLDLPSKRKRDYKSSDRENEIESI